MKTLPNSDFKKGVSGIYLLTPAMAQSLLDSQNGNRPLRENWALEIAGDIDRGAWIYNGDSIKLDKHNRLIDGQHRCMAITVAGKPIPTRIEFGIADEAMYTFDTNRTRTYGDMLHMQHEPNAALLANSVRALWEYNMMVLKQWDGPNAKTKPTKVQLQNVLDTHPGIRDSAAYVYGFKIAMRLAAPRVAVVCHYLSAKVNKAIADRCIEQLDTGIGLMAGSPIYVLRERLNAKIGRHDRIHYRVRWAYTMKAFKAELAGSTMKILKWAEGEVFPRIP